MEIEDLIYYMVRYYRKTLTEPDEKEGFIQYMAEAFNRYATVKRRIDHEKEKLRRMNNGETEEVQEKEESDID